MPKSPTQRKTYTRFESAVRAVVRMIPKGHVLTYKEVAEKAGYRNAARAVGSVLRQNYDSDVPCHRVVRADGTVGEYNRGGPDQKLALLAKEGWKLQSHGAKRTA